MCASAKLPLHKESVDDGEIRTRIGKDTDTERVSFSLVLPMRSQLPLLYRRPCACSMAWQGTAPVEASRACLRQKTRRSTVPVTRRALHGHARQMQNNVLLPRSPAGEPNAEREDARPYITRTGPQKTSHKEMKRTRALSPQVPSRRTDSSPPQTTLSPSLMPKARSSYRVRN